MANDNWWKVYLETVYHNEDELLDYARKYDQMQNDKVQQRLQELREETGMPTFLVELKV